MRKGRATDEDRDRAFASFLHLSRDDWSINPLDILMSSRRAQCVSFDNYEQMSTIVISEKMTPQHSENQSNDISNASGAESIASVCYDPCRRRALSRAGILKIWRKRMNSATRHAEGWMVDPLQK